MGILSADWEALIYNTTQQEKFKLSLTPKFVPSYLSEELYAGTFAGDTNAIVCYLSDFRCNCNENREIYNSVHYPCSHMYRLAYEFGLVDAKGNICEDKKKGEHNVHEVKSNFMKAVFLVEKYISEENQLKLITGSLYYTVSQCIKDEKRIPFRIKACDAEEYLLSGLFSQCFNSNIGLIYNGGFINDVAKKMDENGFTWPTDLACTNKGRVKAKAKKDWCLTHPDEAFSIAYPNGECDYIMIMPTDMLVSIWDELLQYWERKFNDEETSDKFGRYTLRHPASALVTDYKNSCYEFPTDMITEELNKYGHNRCITRKAGVGCGRLYRKQGCSLSFSIKIPTSAEIEKLFSLLYPIASYYDENNRNNIEAFLDVLTSIEAFDRFIDSAAESSFALLVFARSELSKCIKDEYEIKSDFENCVVRLWSGEEVLGYEKIRDRNFTKAQIKNIVFKS